MLRVMGVQIGGRAIGAPRRHQEPSRIIANMQRELEEARAAREVVREAASGVIKRWLYSARYAEVDTAFRVALARLQAAQEMRDACDWHSVTRGRQR